MAYYDKEKHFDSKTGEKFYFYKKHKRDKVWWVEYPNLVGNLSVSFDKKNIIHLFKDYPCQLTYAQKMQFDKENPYWADSFKDRKIQYLFTGKIQKVRVISNSICFGPEPQPDDEVEQHLSITRDGRVFFSSYVYGNERGRYRKIATRNFKADPEKVQDILTQFEQIFFCDYVEKFSKDVGDWKMEIINDSGEVLHFKGSLCGISGGEANLSNLVRDEFDMPNLYVFDGNSH